MYSALARRGRELTFVSVGHRPSLLRYHAKRLRLYGEAAPGTSGRGAQFELEEIREEVETEACLVGAEAPGLS